MVDPYAGERGSVADQANLYFGYGLGSLFASIVTDEAGVEEAFALRVAEAAAA
jgi:hypothetical protein